MNPAAQSPPSVVNTGFLAALVAAVAHPVLLAVQLAATADAPGRLGDTGGWRVTQAVLLALPLVTTGLLVYAASLVRRGREAGRTMFIAVGVLSALIFAGYGLAGLFMVHFAVVHRDLLHPDVPWEAAGAIALALIGIAATLTALILFQRRAALRWCLHASPAR